MGLEAEPQPWVLPRPEIAAGRNRREGEREADQVFSSRAAAVGRRVYELDLDTGFTQRQARIVQYPIHYLIEWTIPNSPTPLSFATGHSDPGLDILPRSCPKPPERSVFLLPPKLACGFQELTRGYDAYPERPQNPWRNLQQVSIICHQEPGPPGH